MKKIETKKLMIARETLMELQADRLVEAVGGHGIGGPQTIVCPPGWVQKLEQIRSNIFCGRR